MRRSSFVLLAVLLVVAAGVARPVAGWFGSGGQATVTALAQATPTPSLGSTPQTVADLPNDNDGDAADYDQVALVVISFLFLGFVVAASLGFYLWRRSRQAKVARQTRHQE
ncbi:hypothetical protein ABZS29_14710 [Kribbella sp. NPDC005582]|uniref:hypothetical protein n=1 Tax=Kribbella sp. NPDC005582 TaxID=3156893 RepID=UPI0033BBCAD4